MNSNIFYERAKKFGFVRRAKYKSEKGKLYDLATFFEYRISFKKAKAKNLINYIARKLSEREQEKRKKKRSKLLPNFISSEKIGTFPINLLKLYSIEKIPRVLKSLKYKRNHNKYFLHINTNLEEITYTLSENYLRSIPQFFRQEPVENYGSDLEFNMNADNISSIYLEVERNLSNIKNKNAFLPFKLTDYVVKNSNENFIELKKYWDRYVSEGNCVGNSIKLLEEEDKIPKGTYTKFIEFQLDNSKRYYIKQKDFQYLAKELNINIQLRKYYEDDCKIYCVSYNSESEVTIKLVSFKDHCFIDEITPFHSWAIEEGYNQEHANNIINKKKLDIQTSFFKNGKYYNGTSRYKPLDSLKFIMKMIINPNLVEPLLQEEILDKIGHPLGKLSVIINKELESGFIQKSNKKQKKASPPLLNKSNSLNDIRIYFDFESYLDQNRKHIFDLLVVKCNDITKIYKTGKYSAAKYFLNDIYKGRFGEGNYILIAHNLGYDINGLANEKGFNIINRISPSKSKVKSAICSYYNTKLYIKDSYSVIPFALSEFDEVFGIPNIKKGACPYSYFNEKTLGDRWANINKCRKYVKTKHLQDFDNSIIEYLNPDNLDEYNHIQHRIDYCIQDVIILEKGYELFSKWVKEIFDENLDYAISIPQLAFNHLWNEGCLNEVCSVRGITQAYLRKFVVGGRCTSAWGDKYIIKWIADLDANSLYPSAMCRPDFIIPEGPGRILTKNECNNFILDNYQCFYVTINILSVGKKRAYPCIPIVQNDRYYEEEEDEYETNERYINDPRPNDNIYVGKIALEDMIKYHNITYKVIGGLAWDNNCKSNNKLTEVIKKLFDARVEMKKKGLKQQQLIKLIMNSAYGRMLLRPFKTEEKWFSEYNEGEYNYDRFKNYTHELYDDILEIEKMDKLVCITKIKSVKNHENYLHIAINILEISKRIMHEVMYLMEDNNIPMYWTDTDSMHMRNKDIPKIEKLFRETYNRELCGNQLQQFSSDFDLPKEYAKTHENPVSKLSIYCGKKTYLDCIEATNKNNLNDKITFHVIRMKGIPQASIEEKCKKKGISLKDLYIQLCRDSKRVKFNMLADNGCSFKFDKLQVKSLYKFNRYVHFPLKLKNENNILKNIF